MMKQIVDFEQNNKMRDLGIKLSYPTIGELIEWIGSERIRKNELHILSALESAEPIDALVELALKIKAGE